MAAVSPAPRSSTGPGIGVLLPFALGSFAANSLITRHVASPELLDAGLVTGVRFLSGAAALLVLALALGERPRIGRANLLPALWLGGYAVCISYGYRFIGAAAGTFVFYALVLLTLVVHDAVSGTAVPRQRVAGALVALAGVAVLAVGAVGEVTVLGAVLLALTGAAWGLYTAAGRGSTDPRGDSTGHFALLGLVLLAPTAWLLTPAADVTITLIGILWSVLMGAGTTAFAYVAWYACQRHLSATTAGTAQMAVPVLTAVGAVALLGESLEPSLAVAAVLVAGGMWLSARPSAPSRANAER